MLRLHRLALPLALALTATSASAKVLRVPADYSTVLAGVDAAVEGDTVLVGPGEWMATDTRLVVVQWIPFWATACVFPSHGMTILSEEGPDRTSLVHPGSGTGSFYVAFCRLSDSRVPITLDGFTITQVGTASTTAVATFWNAGIELRNCRITGMTGSNALLARDADVRMVGTVVSHCTMGDAIEIDTAVLTIDGCRFEDNQGRLLCQYYFNDLHPAGLIVQNSVFLRNRSRLEILYADETSVAIRNNVFQGNVCDGPFGVGIVRTTACDGTIEHNTFLHNSVVAGTGGAVLSWEAARGGWVRNNTFAGSGTPPHGATFRLLQNSSVGFVGNVFAWNTGGVAVGASGDSGPAANACNVFWQNAGGDFRGWSPSPYDIFANPLFCNYLGDDLTLQSDSPCVGTACGLAGATPVACDGISVTPTTWGRIKSAFRGAP